MRHWTQDGAHIASLALVVAGILGMAFATSGPHMAGAMLAAAVGVGGSVALRALETRDENSAGKVALAKLEALEARLGAVEAIAEEGKKVALSASLQAGARHVGRPPTY